MPRFAANLSFLYPDRPFLDRFEAAAADGFDAVECLFPYAHEVRDLAARLQHHGQQPVLFNVPPGDWNAGERGLAAQPGEEARFRDALARALHYAEALGCPRLHVMGGLRHPDAARQRDTFVQNLAWAAAQAAPLGIDLLVEAINPRDMPGYLLQRQQEAHDIAVATGAANVKVQMDLYHCQVVEGDLTVRLRTHLATGRVGHLQVAGVPGRHEPDTGELDIVHLCAEIDAAGYTGHVGCEYHPRGDTSAGLGWLRRCRTAAGS